MKSVKLDEFIINEDDSKKIQKLNITIVGLGLIGGSYAKSIKKLNPMNLWAIDINKNVLDEAENLGIIDKGYLNPKNPLNESDIVIISLYPEHTINFIKENMENFKSGAIITDAAGIKKRVVNEIQSIIREDLDFIGGHPMAGKECSGFDFASEEIFKGASYIITPVERNNLENIAFLKYIIEEMGFKKIMEVSPEKHDKMVAFTSHLPHIIASALVDSDMLSESSSCIGGSFRDATRVANINSDLWSELLLSNRDNIIEQIKLFEYEMEKIKSYIYCNDEGCLKTFFKQVSRKKDELV